MNDLLSHKILVEKYLSEKPFRLSSFSFVNIYAWKDFFDFTFEVIDGHLCIFARYDLGSFMYLPPLGLASSPSLIAKCFDQMQEINHNHGVSRIENVEEEQLSLFNPAEHSFYMKYEEYVYEKEDLISLVGNKYKSQRHAYNYFMSHYNYECIAYDASMQDECVNLYDAWAHHKLHASKDPVFQEMIEQNQSVHGLLLKDYDQVGLIGMVVRIDGKIRAYTLGYRLTEDTFCIFLEVADTQYQGLPAFVFKQFCSDSRLAPFKFINVMDDFGLENIQKVKQSYHPTLMIPSYVVSKKVK